MSADTTTDAARAPATIEEVAAAAGVSRSTVSRVVNGSTAVSPSALESVRRAIADLNYVPNRAARSLASRQTHAIALVVPEDTTRFFGDPFFARSCRASTRALSRSDYVLNLFIASDDPGDKTTSYVRSGAVDGAIIVSHHTSDTFIDRIASLGAGRLRRPAGARARERDYYVDVDNVRGGTRRHGLPHRARAPPHRDDHRSAHDARRHRPPAGLPRRARRARDSTRARSRTATSPPTARRHAMRRILERRRASRRDLRRERPHGPRCAGGARRGGTPRARRHRDHGLRRLAGRDIRHSAAHDDASAVLRAGGAHGERAARPARRRHPRHVTILETELVVRDSV